MAKAARSRAEHGEPLRVEESFARVVIATAQVVGQAYFEQITRLIAETLRVAAAFITEVDADEPARSRFVAYSSCHANRSSPLPEVQASPWSGDSASATQYYPAEVSRRFPDDPILKEERAEVYLAVPLAGSHRACVGYVGVIDTQAMPATAAMEAESLLRLVSARAGAEVERHRAEERMMRETRPFRQFAEESNDVFICWTGDSPPRIAYVNPAIQRLTGYTTQEVQANPNVVLSPILLRAVRGAVASAHEHQRSAVVPFVRKDGQKVQLAVRLTAIADDDRGVRRQQCVLQEASSGEQSDVGACAEPAWLNDVFDAVSLATIVVRNGAVAYMNKRANELTGCGPEDVLGLRITVTGSRADLRSTLGDWAKRLPRSRTGRTIVKATPKRGTERTIEIRSRTMQSAGAPAMLLTATDITDQFRAEQKSRRSADLNRDVLSAVPMAIAVIDRKGLLVAVNESWDESARRSGLVPGRQKLAVGSNYLEACRRAANAGREDARDALIGIGSVLSGSMPQFSAHYEEPAESGESAWCLMTVTPLKADDGAVITLTDITTLKLGERAIAEAETHERGLLQNLPDQMARMTSDGGVVEVLAPTEKSPMVPPLPPASSGRNLRDLLPAAAVDNLLQAIQDATHANRVAICKFALSYEDDERKYETRVVPLSTREVLVFVRDRTSEQWAAAQTAGNGEGPLRRARIAPQNPYGLTFREAAVLELMAHGAADKEIATQLGVSVFTVNKHVSKILRKMDASSRTEASTRTLREGLLD